MDLSFDSLVPMTGGVFLASLLGSAHCVGMCGGLVLASCRRPQQVLGYQLGRLLGYLTLGALGGALGSVLLSSPWLKIGSQVSAVVLALGFFVMGAWLLQGKGTKGFHFLPGLPESWIRQGMKLSGGNAMGVGLLSAALPCGWLHAFVLIAVSAQTVLGGMAVLFLFWLGSVPALSLAPWSLQRVLAPWASARPRLAGLVFVALGILTLTLRLELPAGDLKRQAHPEKAGLEHSSCH